MRSSQGSGDILELTTPVGGIESGDVAVIPPLVVVAAHDAVAGAKFVGEPRGLFLLPKVTTETWTEGALVYWDATEAKATTEPDNTPLGIAVAAATNPSTQGLVLLKQDSGAGRDEWYARRSYVPGQVVLDRGGWWRCVATNTNSQPVSGNANWRWVAGTPYVDVLLDPVALTTAPFVSVATTAGYVLVPAPGNGLAVYPTLLLSFPTPGDAWSVVGSGIHLTYDGSSGYGLISSFGDNLGLTSVDPNNQTVDLPSNNSGGFSWGIAGDPTNSPNNKALTIWATDFGGGALVGGSRALGLRTYYMIVPSTFTQEAFFTITAVNQGTKTFTVNGNASGLGATFTIVGSTGNDGTYTKVSAIFDTDHTDVVVSEAIPDATADGWIEQT